MSKQRRNKVQIQETENQREKGNGENNERLSDASNQADRESSPDDFEETRPRTKRSRPQEGTFEPTGHNLIGNLVNTP